MNIELTSLRNLIIEIASGGRPKGGAIDQGIFSVGAEHLDGLGGFNLSNAKYIPLQYFNSIGNGRIKTNDVLLVKDGATTGKVSFVSENFPLKNAAINEHVFRIEFNSKIIYPKYGYYYLASEEGRRSIMSDFRGATVGGITKGIIDKIQVPLPPLSIQKSIVEILDAADSLNRKDRELLKKYNDLAQSIFFEMFGNPVKNDRKWEVKKLRNLSTKILSGNTPKGGSNVYVDRGIVFFRSQNVWKNRLEVDDIAFIDKLTHEKMSKSSLKNGDILMTKTGRINTENSSLGRAALFAGVDDSANINGHVYLIRLKENIIRKYVLFILTTDAYREHIREVCVGGIDKRQLNKEHIEEFPIIFPPIELQKQFADRMDVIEKQKNNLQISSKKSEKLFEDLLQKAFKGELSKTKELV